jgi:hypothetical protein
MIVDAFHILEIDRIVITTIFSRRYYLAAPAKVRVLLANLARIGIFYTRNAYEANRYTTQFSSSGVYIIHENYGVNYD